MTEFVIVTKPTIKTTTHVGKVVLLLATQRASTLAPQLMLCGYDAWLSRDHNNDDNIYVDNLVGELVQELVGELIG